MTNIESQSTEILDFSCVIFQFLTIMHACLVVYKSNYVRLITLKFFLDTTRRFVDFGTKLLTLLLRNHNR